jgi:hypothetical protein
MKVWSGYGSEHSMNLVMIGTFKQANDAKDAKDLIDNMAAKILDERDKSPNDESLKEGRFSREMLDFLVASKLNTIGPTELEQFTYEVGAKVNGNRVELWTDEADVSAFIKLLVERGAKVEVYSAHDYPDERKAR